MSLPWFRMYAEFATDPVVQSLAFEDQRHYTMVLCMKCAGILDRNISPRSRNRIILRSLGLDSVAADEAKRRLMEVGLVNKNWQPKGWEKRQFKSDTSTERVHKSRKNKETGNVSEAVMERSEMPPETEADTESEGLLSSPPPPVLGSQEEEPHDLKELQAGDLPEWLTIGQLNEYREHRKALKAKMTPLAERKLVNELARLREAGDDPAAVLNQSITNGWKGVFPLKRDRASTQDRNREKGKQEIDRFVKGDGGVWGVPTHA